MKQSKLGFLTLMFAFFVGIWNTVFKVSPTMKGGTNKKFTNWMDEVKHRDNELGLTRNYKRLERYSGHKKYHKVPTIQNF